MTPAPDKAMPDEIWVEQDERYEGGVLKLGGAYDDGTLYIRSDLALTAPSHEEVTELATHIALAFNPSGEVKCNVSDIDVGNQLAAKLLEKYTIIKRT